MTLDIRRACSDDDLEDATALLHDFVEWMRAAGGFDPLTVQPALADELAALGGHYRGSDRVLLLARWHGRPAGTAAVRFHSNGTAELKRMYVRPVARGHGIADALIERSVGLAVDRGCTSIWLETLRGVMDRAIALYRRHDFRELDSGGRTLHLDRIVVMERALCAEPTRAPDSLCRTAGP